MIRFFKHLKVIFLCSLLLLVTTTTYSFTISASSNITIQEDTSHHPIISTLSLN